MPFEPFNFGPQGGKEKMRQKKFGKKDLDLVLRAEERSARHYVALCRNCRGKKLRDGRIKKVSPCFRLPLIFSFRLS